MKPSYTLRYQLSDLFVSRHRTLGAAVRAEIRLTRACRKNGDMQRLIIEADDGAGPRRLTHSEMNLAENIEHFTLNPKHP